MSLLGLGIVSAIALLAGFLRWMLEAHPIIIWSFFLGLILASIPAVLRRVKNWSSSLVLYFMLGLVAAYFLVGLAPAQTPEIPLYFFLSGFFASVAMILPGVSGSFVLVIIGKYQQILEAVVGRELFIIAVFVLGAVLGLVLFSKILNYLLGRHHDAMIATLAGLMLGAARKIWPFKEQIAQGGQAALESHLPVSEVNVLPMLDVSILPALMAFCLGVVVVYLIHQTPAAH